MTDAAYHLAQLNIARMRFESVDDPGMAGFVARLDEINTLAEASPGFVWRLQSSDGNATSIRAFDDPRVIVNLTVWESVETLFDYAYKSAHVEVFRGRKDWFEPFGAAYLVMWWIPAGHIPTVTEAQERLEYLEAHGVTPYAFTFKTRFTVADFLKTAARE